MATTTAYRTPEPLPESPRERLDSGWQRTLARVLLVPMTFIALAFLSGRVLDSTYESFCAAGHPLALSIALSIAALLPTVSAGRDGLFIETAWRTTSLPWNQVARIDKKSLIGRFGRIERVQGRCVYFFANGNAFDTAERHLATRRATSLSPVPEPYPPSEQLHSTFYRGVSTGMAVFCLGVVAVLTPQFVVELLRSGELTHPELVGVVILFGLMALFIRWGIGWKVVASESGLLLVRGANERRIPWSDVSEVVSPNILNRTRGRIELADGTTIRFAARPDTVAIANRYRALARARVTPPTA